MQINNSNYLTEVTTHSRNSRNYPSEIFRNYLPLRNFSVPQEQLPQDPLCPNSILLETLKKTM